MMIDSDDSDVKADDNEMIGEFTERSKTRRAFIYEASGIPCGFYFIFIFILKNSMTNIFAASPPSHLIIHIITLF